MNARMKLASSLLLSAGMGFSGHLWAAACSPMSPLPTATTANSVSFGDGLTYSLALPSINITYGSGPGQIQNCIVIATGTSGQPINNNSSLFIDNPYQTPTGTDQQPSNPYFRTGDPVTSPDPGGALQFVGDTATSWDIRLATLSQFLAGGQMVVMFNHNQTNSGDAINQSLAIWAQIRLVDDAGVLPTLYFYVASSPGTALPNFGTPGDNTAVYTGPQTLPTSTYPTGADGTCSNPTNPGGTFPQGGVGFGTNSDACYMVQARGQVCLNGTTDVPEPCGATAGQTVLNNNLGADRVANAVLFPEIQAFLNLAGFGGYDVLQADIRMGCNPATFASAGGTTGESFSPCPAGFVLNNGYEQIFITSTEQPTIIPEPAPLALVSLGLVLLGFQLRRKA